MQFVQRRGRGGSNKILTPHIVVSRARKLQPIFGHQLYLRRTTRQLPGCPVMSQVGIEQTCVQGGPKRSQCAIVSDNGNGPQYHKNQNWHDVGGWEHVNAPEEYNCKNCCNKFPHGNSFESDWSVIV